jgi:predicted RNase H-like nuclease (RuvC/YqgF family)
MSDFSESARKIHESTEAMLAAVRGEASRLLEQMDDADAKFEEQDNTIASLRETARMQAEEIERISADYQDKIDRLEGENAALRSRLGTKDKNFSILSRAVVGMMQSAKHLTAMGGHAFNIINRDAMGDKIVTQLRGRPQRNEIPVDGQRVDGDPYAPLQRQAAR